MGATRLLQNAITKTPGPITVKEFGQVISKVWTPTNFIRHGQEATIGLAISGGVDSMALALLCSHLKAANTQPIHDGLGPHPPQLSNGNYQARIKFQAFVVDHGARSGSDVEAQAVSKNLEKLGIPAQVLTIEWPEEPKTKLNFESLARKYRFRTLGKACSDMGINSLFLAHHEDDQAETIMMRLVAGHRVKGLMGIRYHSEIPECYGLHGVHESGSIDNVSMRRFPKPWQLDTTSLPTRESSQKEDIQWKPQLTYENGGVRVYRPLLDFSKERLIATCQKSDVEWFEDHTNKDQTLTKRNAIRHMFAEHSLPAALTKPALLDLSRKLRDREALRQEITNSWVSRCKISQLDLRVGTAKVRFADLGGFRESCAWPQADSGQTAAEVLKRIVMLVTPDEHVELSSLHGAVAHIFPELRRDESPVGPTAFTVCSVYFQQIRPKVRGIGSCLAAGPDHNGKPEWHLSRQPHTAHEKRENVLTIPLTKDCWSPWKLFDGRYWIRIKACADAVLLLRPLPSDKWSALQDALEKQHWRVRGILKLKAPGNIKWTVPAILSRTADGVERVIALPTLGLCIPGLEKYIKWEVRYKKIDTAGMDIVGDVRRTP